MPNLELLKKSINLKSSLIFTGACFLGLATLNLVSTNTLCTEGITVSEAETKTLKLEKENHTLTIKIEEATQLKNIESMAMERGFVRSKNIVFVQDAPTFAQR